jgi:hypothetical protein
MTEEHHMSGHRRAVAVLLGVACVAVGLAAPAQADTNDDRFAEIVAGLGIPVDPRPCRRRVTRSTGLRRRQPGARRAVRDMLRRPTAWAPSGGGLLKAAASVYCPENLAYLGR